MSAVEFDSELIERYNRAGPRYTSYPTAVQFRDYPVAEYASDFKHARAGLPGQPISLYFHIPFCDTLCYYCGCNKIVTKRRERTLPYLDGLLREIELRAALFDKPPPIDQLHWGGGTPTFLDAGQMQQLMETTDRYFPLRSNDEGEYSIEIDPREANGDTMALLRRIGFNRLSFGVQDFNPKVQKAVNRIQSEQETFALMNAARDEGFQSISLDLIYGLPFQTVESFRETLTKIIKSNPDRLSLFNYAHLPTLFMPQRRINETDLPSPQEKLGILQTSIQMLTDAGYLFIGMDHFAKPDDELAIAQRQGGLHRNFQGYSTHAEIDLLAMGVSSISKLGASFSQNYKDEPAYYAAIQRSEIPVCRGVRLTKDDLIRQQLISKLICHFHLRYGDIEQQFDIGFKQYFETELASLNQMERDQLLIRDEDGLRVLPKGKLLIRNICMQFDFYQREKDRTAFSKLI